MATANTPPPDTGALETLVRQGLAGRAHVRDLRVILLNEGIAWRGGRRHITPSNSPSTWW